MNFSFEIVLYRRGRKGYIYTYRIDGDPQTELEKFLGNSKHITCKEYNSLKARLHQMADRQGFREGFFKRNESKSSNTISALHYNSKSLRLYCYYTSLCIIVGNGGSKGKGAYQKYEDCNNAVINMEEVDRRFFERIKEKEVRFDADGRLIGNLSFPQE